MTPRALTFDVYESRFPRSELGTHRGSVDAPDHRTAKEIAAECFGPHVVVLPRSKNPPLDARSRAFLRASRSTPPRTRP